MALAQLYSRAGESKQAEIMMASLTGGTASSAGNDFFAGALRDDVDPSQAEHDAEKNLNNLGDQFDSGEYDRPDQNSFSAMDMVALSWARLGWARFLQGENLEASQFLEAAWTLSQSGTVANRLARVYEKTGARDRARHMYALAAVAGGQEVQASRERVAKLGSGNVDQELSRAATELEKMRTLALPQVVSQTASARFSLLFDNSNSPDRVQFLDGDDSLRNSGEKLQRLEYPVRFPDVSSIKIVRMGAISCSGSACKFELQPLNSMQPNTRAAGAAALPKQ